MKKLLIPAFAFWLSCLFQSCTSTSPNHFLKEADYRNKVEADFGQKKEILNRGNLFDIFNEDMSLEEREAMMFLYAYMTPGDISDYSGEFYLKNVRLALQNRKETSWGAGIPDMIFRHFVLPVRVNNENLDNAREVFRQELMPRVEKLSMYDAVLEVNHWCHEKVIYTPTDIRTSAPMATVKTAYGRCGEESTFLVVYASANDHFGLQKVSFGKDKEVTLTLSHRPGDVFTDTLHIVPPAEKANFPEVTDAQRKENNRRMAQEDSIRNAYVASFPTEEKAKAFAEGLKLDVNQTSTYILKSRGNHADIMQFLSNAAEKGQGARALELLSTLADKDLRDTPCSILEDHLYATDAKADVKEVLAPRIATEMLTPYRTYLQKALSAELAAQIKADPQVLVKWCKDSLSIRNDLSTIFTITSPEGVWRSRVTDSQSRDIFFVAAARSLGIPAWKDEVNGNICYRLNGKPVLVDFESSEGGSLSEGVLKATYQAIPRLDNPKYNTHFTLSKYDNGTFQLQNHPEDASWASLLKNGSSMSTGYYMMVTGSRMANGGVLIQVSFFSVDKGKTTVTPLCMRNNTEEVRVIGSFNSEALYTRPGTDEQVSVLNTTGRGYYIVGVLGVGQEPTNHALKDIEVKKAEFEKWGRTIVLLFTDEAAYKKFDRKEFPNLPSNVVFGIDKDGSILKMIAENMKLGSKPTLPVIILGDTFNRVVFESHGYTIGMGEQLLHVIHGL